MRFVFPSAASAGALTSRPALSTIRSPHRRAARGRAWLCGALTIVAQLLLAPSAMAIPFTWEFLGEVTVENALLPVPVGTEFTFRATLDTTATDNCALAGEGIYTFGPGSVSFLGSDYESPFVAYEAASQGTCLGATPGSYSLRFFPTGTVFSTASIGWATPDIGELVPVPHKFPTGDIGFTLSMGGVNAFGTIREVRLVPEPALMSLLATALVGGIYRRRSRRVCVPASRS